MRIRAFRGAWAAPGAGRWPGRIWPATGPQAPGTVPGTAPEQTSGPVRRPGLSWGYAWQVLGSNQRRRMPAILQGAHPCPSEWPLTCGFSIPGQ